MRDLVKQVAAGRNEVADLGADSAPALFPGLEILLDANGTAGKRSLPGRNAGAQFKDHATQQSSTLGRRIVTLVIRDLPQGRHVKATKDLFLPVVMETTMNLIGNDP